MGQSRASRWLKSLLALLAVASTGLTGLLFAKALTTSPDPFPLPERVEWHTDPHSGAASLLLHGLKGNPWTGVLVPLHSETLPFPGLHEVWRELFSHWQIAPLPDQRDGFDGLQMFDLASDSNLALVKLQPLPGRPLGVAVRGRRLWLACAKSGLSVLDLSDAQKPVVRKVWAAPRVTAVAFAGNLALLLNDAGRLEIVEIAPSGQARIVARHSLQQADVVYEAMAVHQDRLLLLKYNQNAQQRVLSSYQLASLGQRDTQPVDVLLPVSSVANSWWLDGRLYLATVSSRLVGVDVDNPVHPRVFMNAELSAPVSNMVWSGRRGLAHLADNSVYGLTADISDEKGWVANPLGLAHKGVCAYLVYVAGRLYSFSQERGIEVFQALPILTAIQSTVAPAVATSPMVAHSFREFRSPDMLHVATLPMGMAVLDKGGSVRLLNAVERRAAADSPVAIGEEICWLAAHGDRLYAGGGATIAVLRADAQKGLVRIGEVASPGGQSFDAVVVDDTLCVAAGRQGVVGFSLADPDHPVARPSGQFPALLQQRLNVKSVAAQGRQLFAAGGEAGILTLTVDRDHRVRPDGFRPIADPVYAVAVADKLLLAATKTNIHLLATSHSKGGGSLQFLGALPFKNIKRLAALGKGYFGVRQAVGGWQLLPLPVLMPGQTGKPPRLRLPAGVAPGSYRLLLFNREEVTAWPAMLTVAAQASARPGGG